MTYRLLVMVAATTLAFFGLLEMAVAGEPASNERPAHFVLCATPPERQGCCSWHGGVCGCQDGRDVCCDGNFSPSCTCNAMAPRAENELEELAQEYVQPYVRSDGTYVNGYWRSSPDGDPYNNYSFAGNTNPYTGKVAPGNPDTYLRNYYDRNGSSGYSGEEGQDSGDSSDSEGDSDGGDN